MSRRLLRAAPSIGGLTLLAAGCWPTSASSRAETDCVAEGAVAEAYRRGARATPATYDAHAQLDTAPDAVTRVKGCILLHLVSRYDSVNGGLPATLQSLVPQVDIDSQRISATEWYEDGWRRPLMWRVVATGAQLSSRGPDGLQATADDVTFPTVKAETVGP